MRATHRIASRVLIALPLIALLLAAGATAAAGGVGRQRSFLAHLTSLERAVTAAQASLDTAGQDISGHIRAVSAKAATLETSSARLRSPRTSQPSWPTPGWPTSSPPRG